MTPLIRRHYAVALYCLSVASALLYTQYQTLHCITTTTVASARHVPGMYSTMSHSSCITKCYPISHHTSSLRYVYVSCNCLFLKWPHIILPRWLTSLINLDYPWGHVSIANWMWGSINTAAIISISKHDSDSPLLCSPLLYTESILYSIPLFHLQHIAKFEVKGLVAAPYTPFTDTG